MANVRHDDSALRVRQAVMMAGSRVGRLALRGPLAASVLALSLGCLDDSPVTASSPSIRATLSANVVGAMAGGTVRIRVGYRTRTQQLVALPSSPEQIAVAAGTTIVVPVTVDIGPCLADVDRAPLGEPGCKLVIELTLSDAAGGVIDTQTREASGEPVTPGHSVDFGTVTIGLIVSTVVVAPTTLNMTPTDEQRLTATVRDASGSPVTTLPISWTTSDPTVVQLSATTGASITVLALKTGTATVSASASGKSSAPVTVSVAPPAPLTIRQPQGAGCVIVGQTLALAVDSPPGAVAWSSASPNVASIGPTTGVVTGIANGTALITATSGNRTGSATVCVTGPLRVLPTSIALVAGRTSQLTVSGVTGGTLSYASNATSVATVDANGLVRGVGVGQATVTVTFTAPSGTESVPVQVTVSAAAVVIEPSSGSAALSRTTPFHAILQDVNGLELPSVAVTWSIADPTIGSLSATSAVAIDVRALKVGTTTIRATSGTVSATAQFTALEPLPAARLEKVSGDGSVCPTRSTSCTFVVRALDVNGVPVAGASVSWASDASCGAPKVATTDDNGLSSSPNLCSAVKAGSYTQTATLQTNQQQARFTYSLRGLVVSFAGIDSYGVLTFNVTSPSGSADGLSASIEYLVGPVTGYVAEAGLSRTTAPATVQVAYEPSNLPFDTYAFNVVVSTTTPGIGPGFETYTFEVNYDYSKQPNARLRTPPTLQPAIVRPRAP